MILQLMDIILFSQTYKVCGRFGVSNSNSPQMRDHKAKFLLHFLKMSKSKVLKHTYLLFLETCLVHNLIHKKNKIYFVHFTPSLNELLRSKSSKQAKLHTNLKCRSMLIQNRFNLKFVPGENELNSSFCQTIFLISRFPS